MEPASRTPFGVSISREETSVAKTAEAKSRPGCDSPQLHQMSLSYYVAYLIYKKN